MTTSTESSGTAVRQVPKSPLQRALSLKCPRCGVGDLFRGWFSMHRRCSQCGLKYERSPGYFLGSTYVNYGATVLSETVLFVVLRFYFELDKLYVTPICVAWFIILPLLMFRYSRAYWLALDCVFDSTDFAEAPRIDRPLENEDRSVENSREP